MPLKYFLIIILNEYVKVEAFLFVFNNLVFLYVAYSTLQSIQGITIKGATSEVSKRPKHILKIFNYINIKSIPLSITL